MKKLLFYFSLCIVITPMLSAQSTVSAASFPVKIPLSFLISNPNIFLPTDITVQRSLVSNNSNIRQVYNSFEVQERSFHTTLDEWKKIQQWIAGGVLIGFGAGCVYGIIKTRSINDAALFGVTRPLAVFVYGVEGALIGGAVGAVAYLIFKYPVTTQRGDI